MSLLLAMLLPILANSRESSRRTTCAIRLKQFGGAVISFAGERRERLPATLYEFNGRYPNFFRVEAAAGDVSGDAGEWSLGAMTRYLPGHPVADGENRQAAASWWCPSANPDAWRQAAPVFWDSFGVFMSAYSYYGQVGRWSASASHPEELTDSTLESSRVLMSDTCFYWQLQNAWIYNHAGDGGHYRDQAAKPNMAGLNELFGDGHAVWKSIDQMAAAPAYPLDANSHVVRGGGEDVCFY